MFSRKFGVITPSKYPPTPEPFFLRPQLPLKILTPVFTSGLVLPVFSFVLKPETRPPTAIVSRVVSNPAVEFGGTPVLSDLAANCDSIASIISGSEPLALMRAIFNISSMFAFAFGPKSNAAYKPSM